MARIEIDDATVHVKKIQYARNNKVQTAEINYQDAWIFLSANKHPFKYQLNVESPEKAYAPGIYDVDLERCFKVDEYGRMKFDDRAVVLIPSKATKAT